MEMTKFAPDPALAVAIFGSAALDSPEAIDSDNLPGDDAADDATMQAPFELFFTQAALQNLGLCKSDEPAKTSNLAKAGIPRKFGYARVETREIEGTLWACAFDADGVMVDQQEIGPASLGKRGSDLSWDDELTPSPPADNFQKRSSAPLAKSAKVARIERTTYPLTGVVVCAEFDSRGVCVKTYKES